MGHKNKMKKKINYVLIIIYLFDMSRDLSRDIFIYVFCDALLVILYVASVACGNYNNI